MTVAKRRGLVAGLRAQGLSFNEVAAELGCAKRTVQLDAQTLGLPRRARARRGSRSPVGATALLQALAERGLAPGALPVAAALVHALDEDAAA